MAETEIFRVEQAQCTQRQRRVVRIRVRLRRFPETAQHVVVARRGQERRDLRRRCRDAEAPRRAERPKRVADVGRLVRPPVVACQPLANEREQPTDVRDAVGAVCEPQTRNGAVRETEVRLLLGRVAHAALVVLAPHHVVQRLADPRRGRVTTWLVARVRQKGVDGVRRVRVADARVAAAGAGAEEARRELALRDIVANGGRLGGRQRRQAEHAADAKAEVGRRQVRLGAVRARALVPVSNKQAIDVGCDFCLRHRAVEQDEPEHAEKYERDVVCVVLLVRGRDHDQRPLEELRGLIVAEHHPSEAVYSASTVTVGIVVVEVVVDKGTLAR